MKTLEQHLLQLLSRGSAEYGLLEDGDRVLVAVSGGKDSMVLTRLLALRSRILKPRFTVEVAHVIMDNIPYETDRTYLEQYCKELGIPCHLLHGSFDETTDHRHTHCFLCSWTRRKLLFRFAEEHGFNKVALGHHQDDMAVTLLMNMTFNGSMQSMAPRMPMEQYPITVIRPLCLVREQQIKDYAAELQLQGQKALCPYEEKTQRAEFSSLLRQMEGLCPDACHNIWHAMQNIKQDQLPAKVKR